MCSQLSVITLFMLIVSLGCSAVAPLALHPENPRYFLFRGKPTVLISSAEHYGAVLNSEFDQERYLNALSADGLNHSRVWVGAYREKIGVFNIAGNTLAPVDGKFICPWARSDQPGCVDGGNRFDLTKWDDAYFIRLRNFARLASVRGVILEINLFCPFYTDDMWALSPMNAQNNINQLGKLTRTEPYTLDRHGGLLEVQEKLARKVVAELKDFDNIYYEIMNEPYVCKVPMDWQRHMVRVLVGAQRACGDRHLISMNIANEKEKVIEPDPAVSIFNFHYAWPPETVEMNDHLRGVIGENETGIVGGSDFFFRREGWAFILAGGGLFSNLDYSFTVGHEDGTFAYPPTQPGGGSVTLRKQLSILKRFIDGLDFVRMSPLRSGIRIIDRKDLGVYALAETGKHYAIYLCNMSKEAPTDAGPAELEVDLPAGAYRSDWISTLTGEVLQTQTLGSNGTVKLSSPRMTGDIALRIDAK